MKRILILFIGFCFSCTAVMLAQNQFSVYNLTCEYEESPIGLETLNPRFSWKISALQRSFEQSAWHLLVADSKEELEVDNGNVWNSGKITSSSSILIPFGGKLLKPGKRYFWKVKIWDSKGNASLWSETSFFQMGLFDQKDWGNALWISMEEDRRDEIITSGIHAPHIKKEIGERKIGMYHLPQFRKAFPINKRIENAVVYVSGLGHFDMYLNGDKVGDNFLDPGWTKYDKCALYVSFDITNKLRQGDNTIGIMLGNGFYNIPRERYLKMITSYGAPKMIMKVEILYSDGTVQTIVSDDSWKTTKSPITFSSIYGGEDYDATKEQVGWMLSHFDDQKWANALVSDFNTLLISQRATPLKIRNHLPTVRLLETESGDWVYDLGQNFSGILELKVKGKRGESVKLHPAELLNTDQSVNQSASGYPFYFTYTLQGGKIEDWKPQFTYYGFRYVQIEGAVPIGKPNPDNLPEVVGIEGLHTCNSASEVGRFSCSNEMFNKIYNLIDWSMRSNMASVITDCPHREKLGWLEVAHLMQYSFQYRYHMARLYSKKMNDMRSTQAANGQVPTIAPELVEFEGGFKDTPEWGSAFIICPWYIYEWYGDSALIKEYYPEMKRYLDYLTSKADNHIIAYGLGDWFDIGPNNPGQSQLTSNGVTATAIYYYNTTIMEKVARLIGEDVDALKYKEQATEIKKAFNNTFWDVQTKKYDKNSQAANAIALYTGLVNEDNKKQTLENLINDIRERDNALTAGDVGYRYVLRALEANDFSNIIYDMNCKYDVPGYGWQLAHGATSLTESWQAYGFVSNNHCMLGHLMEWLFSGLGGVRQSAQSIAYKEVIFKPEIVGDINEASVSYESPYGLIVSEWKDDDRFFTLRLELPANSAGKVYLPTGTLSGTTEGGLPVSKVEGVLSTFQEQDRTVIKIGSGVYNFRVTK